MKVMTIKIKLIGKKETLRDFETFFRLWDKDKPQTSHD